MRKVSKMTTPEIIEQSLFDYKLQETTCSIQEIRLPIFAPIKKATPKSAIYDDFINNKRTRIVETAWGEVKVKGYLLTQVHKDLLDLIVLKADKKAITDDNRLLIQFSVARVLEGYGDKGYNYKWFRVMLDELMGSVIHLNTHNKKGYAFHIISAMKYDDKKEFVGILLSSEYLKFYKENFAIDYNKETLNIISIDSPILRSIVRFFLSHNNLNIKIDDLFEAIGIKTDKKDRFYRYIKRILKENAAMLESFNIKIQENTVIYKGNNNVKFFLN